MRVLVGIDVGTSKVGVGVYDDRGRRLARGEAAVRGQSVEGWLEALRRAVPRALLEGLGRGEVVVSAAGTSGTIVLVDSRGAPVYRPVMYYESSRRGYERLRGSGLDRLAARSGIDHGPSSTLAKLAELSEAGVLGRARWILSQSTWLLHRLVYREGEEWHSVSMDFNNALKFGADVLGERPSWLEGLLEPLGVPLDLMPAIVKCGAPVGVASSRLAEELGLKGAIVRHGTTDGNASALASGALREGDLSIYTGTTTVAKHVVNSPVNAPGVYYHRHPIAGFLDSAATAETGGFLSWLAREVMGVSVEEALDAASRVEPGSEPLFYPPGYRSPLNRPGAMAIIAGVRPEARGRMASVGYVARGVAVGVAMLEAYFVEFFERLSGKHVEEVRVSGGTTRSRFWNQLRASIYQRRVSVYGEDVTLGALIPAVIEAGIASLDEVEGHYVRPLEAVDPDPRLARAYEGLRRVFMETWKRLLEALPAI